MLIFRLNSNIVTQIFLLSYEYTLHPKLCKTNTLFCRLNLVEYYYKKPANSSPMSHPSQDMMNNVFYVVIIPFFRGLSLPYRIAS